MKAGFWIFFLFQVLLSNTCTPRSSDAQNVTALFEYVCDTSLSVPFDQIKNIENWKQIQTDQLTFNFTDDIIWLRGKTSNPSFQSGQILSLDWKALDSAILYFPVLPNEYKTYVTGDILPKSKWSLPDSPYPSFQIPSEGKGNYFYIRLQSKSLISFPIKSFEIKSFNKRIILESAFNWLILGVCTVMIVFALFYFIAFGLSEFFFYAGYVVCTVLWYNGQYGNAYDVFWPESPWWQNKAILVFATLGIPFSFQFVRMFLDTKKYNPTIDKLLLFIGLLALLCIPAIFFSYTTKVFSRIAAYIYLISIPLILGTGIQIYRKGEKQILFFLLSWGTYFIISYNTILYFLGILPYSTPLLYSAVFIFPIDLFFLLFNLLQKYEKLEGERNEILHRIVSLNPRQTSQYLKSKLDFINTDESLQRLELWMQETKPYLDENLDLEMVSRAIKLSIQQTSELLNSKLGISFRNYVNSYRIREAKRILKEQPDMSILSIAFATGFGSKTSFNVEFKKSTGMSPQAYRRS